MNANELPGSVDEALPTPKYPASSRPDLCRELGLGESTIISEEPGQGPTPLVSRRYRITRSAQNTNLYTAEINFNFILSQARAEELYGHAGHDHSVLFQAQNDEQRAAFINRARDCFRSVDGKLRSPNGTQLNLRVSSYDSNVSQSTVVIEANSIRSHAAAWAGRLSCATIVHESMHLLGLVDGYRETDPAPARNPEK